MKKLLLVAGFGLAVSGCVSLCYQERHDLEYLRANGIDVNHGRGGYEPPNSVVCAGALNLLPGFGNFYLAFGRGNDPVQGVFGFVNLLFWPISIVWAAPQAAVDAHTLNEREMLYFYRYDKCGKEELQRRNLELR